MILIAALFVIIFSISAYWSSIALILWSFNVAPVASWSLFGILSIMIVSSLAAGFCRVFIKGLKAIEKGKND